MHARSPGQNKLDMLDASRWQYHWPDLEPFPPEWHGEMLHFRETYWPGMILNVNELTGIVHLPSPEVFSDRLRRVRTQTRPAPQVRRERGSIVLGENTHRGITTTVVLPADMRARHVYIAGASGTGKSTLLLNMIVQDIAAGEGVGVIDPHGDLITEVLRRVPPSRVSDCISFNPADTEQPVGFNILQAADETEAERIVSETVTAFRRYFGEGWGARLEHILTHALYTAVGMPGTTLREVRRLLIDESYRAEVVSRLRTPALIEFWGKEFPNLPKNAVDPILNKLSPFLLSRTVSSVICQPETKINFDAILATRKVFLANLSTGLLSEHIAGVLGMFLVEKIVNAAFRRARVPRDRRPPFHLYIDEFQNFTSDSGFDRILSEARKYNLSLEVANQYVAQLSDEVRHAIIGNVGTMISFRLGTEDTRLLGKEFGVFSVDEILNLERGQAICRIGGSGTAFNLLTHAEPPAPAEDPTSDIVAETRRQYTTSNRLTSTCPTVTGRPTDTGQQRPSRRPNRDQRIREPVKAEQGTDAGDFVY